MWYEIVCVVRDSVSVWFKIVLVCCVVHDSVSLIVLQRGIIIIIKI